MLKAEFEKALNLENLAEILKHSSDYIGHWSGEAHGMLKDYEVL